MDNFAAVFTSVWYYLIDAWDWLTLLSPAQCLRVFWVVVFLELPRYTAANLYIFYLYLSGNLHEKVRAGTPQRAPLVSIIVPAHNEGPIISATVESLAEQDYPNIEIVIIDDGSTDTTVE
jgi:cellulose synthase/poly-beta-1,6-N-acetylglucosamine synthase-like glycosyltransferase